MASKPARRSPANRSRSGYEGDPASDKSVPLSARKLDPRKLKSIAFVPRGNQKAVLTCISKHDLTFLVGPAGTGKTFLPVAFAVDQLIKGNISKIVAVRPAVEAGDSIGFLTGGLADKMGPYLRPVLDAFEKFLGKPQLDAMMTAGLIEITSLTYLRGRTIEDAVYIMDEMQNATDAQLKMALTRIGENCTAVVTMDPGQCDIHYNDSCIHELNRFESAESIAVVRFSQAQVVRSEIVKTILGCYND